MHTEGRVHAIEVGTISSHCRKPIFLHVYIRRSSVSLTHSSTTCRSGSQGMKPVGQSATSYLLSTSQLGAVFIRSLPAINKVLMEGRRREQCFFKSFFISLDTPFLFPLCIGWGHEARRSMVWGTSTSFYSILFNLHQFYF